MGLESKQPHTSSLRGRQIFERRKEIDPIRKRSASNGAGRGGDASELTPLESSLSLTGLSNVLELVHPIR